MATRGGASWALDLNEGIDFSIWLLGGFEPRTLSAYRRLVQPGATVFDIGANIGSHTLPLARLVGPNGRVVSFEPTAWASERLRQNLALNPDLAKRVDTIQAMLAERNDADLPAGLPASWPLKSTADVHPELRGRSMTTEGAHVMTLDAYATAAALGRVDVMKLDVDGYECRVLTGARHVLHRFRPRIVMELAPYLLEEKGGSLEQLLQILGEARYQLRDLYTGRFLPEDISILRGLVPRGASRNVLAEPAA